MTGPTSISARNESRVGIAPPAQQIGTAVLIQGAAVVELDYLLARGVLACQLDGVYPTSRLRPLLDVVSAAACEAKASGVGRMPPLRGRPPARSGVLDEIGTAEVATLLGICHRQAQRLMPRLGAHTVPGGALVVARGAAEAYLAARRTRTN